MSTLCVSSIPSATQKNKCDFFFFFFKGLGHECFNPSLILNKENTVMYPQLQGTDKTFLRLQFLQVGR